MDYYIPLTSSILEDFNSSMYYFAETVRVLSTSQELGFNPNSRSLTIHFDAAAKKTLGDVLGVSKNTFYAGGKNISPVMSFLTADYLTLMRFQTWIDFKEKVDQFSSFKTRNIYTKVGMFLYMNISAKNNLYGISVENLARELKMDASTVSKILIGLERNDFIIRSKYQFNSEDSRARQYSLPKKLGTDQRIYEEEHKINAD